MILSSRLAAISLSALLLPLASWAQDAAPAPAAQASPQPVPAPAAKKPAGPDYPDPRTFTVGISYWLTVPGSGPNVREGLAGTAFGTVNGLGGDHSTPGIEASVPITRTGVLHFEGFLSKGDGSQNAPIDTNPYGTSFNKGDYLATQYQVTVGKVYLDDLLYPYKFPVARLRLKSLWEFQYIAIHSTIDAPLKPITQDSSGDVVSTTASATKSIIFPTFGIAMEYDLAPHLMLRVGGSGFGLPHRAAIGDGEATISYRHKALELVGGFKALYFKTSPQKDYFLTDTLAGGFVGVRWHF